MDKQVSNGVDLQVDIETLGVNKHAPIISIGAVLFDPRGSDTFEGLRAKAYYAGINMESAVKVCGAENISAGTIAWWFQQDPAALQRLITGDLLPLERALSGLWQYSHARTERQPEWLRNTPIPGHVWANSPSFDMSIIRSACEKLNIMVPFHFASEQDVRTAKLLGWPDGDVPRFNVGVAHDAADDAVAQALLVQAAYRELGLAYDTVERRK